LAPKPLGLAFSIRSTSKPQLFPASTSGSGMFSVSTTLAVDGAAVPVQLLEQRQHQRELAVAHDGNGDRGQRSGGGGEEGVGMV
jgi:hypothetical protein